MIKLRNSNCDIKKNSNCDETQKPKMKLKNSNGDKTQKFKWWQNSKTKIVKKLNNSNCDKTLKTQVVTKLKLWQNPNWDKTQVLHIVIKLNYSNCDKTQKLKFGQNLNYHKSQFLTKSTYNGSFSKNILKPWQKMRYSAFCDSRDVFLFGY